jgi:AcrR family transcriptional regulator/DNA-binding MarR family transcriptional regulator
MRGGWFLMGAAVVSNGRMRARKGAGAADAPGQQPGGAYVSVLQRARVLDATVGLVCEFGARQLTVRRVTVRAGVSSKTFYDLFADREECLLATFDRALDQLATVARSAYGSEGEWVARVRRTLGALLVFLDGEQLLRRFVFVDALACGPRVLERRARVLEELARVIDGGRADTKAGRELPPFTAEGAVGAVWGVIHARLLEGSPGPLSGLLNPLMATIVLPYCGPAAATRELSRPAPTPSDRGRNGADTHTSDGPVGGTGASSAAPVDFRPTLRTFTVLSAIAERPGLNNREVSGRAGVSDQGQISRLLWRLEDQGLVQNTGGREQGTPKAWSLTALGEQALQVSRPHSALADSTVATGNVTSTGGRKGVEASVGRGV